MKKLVLFCVVGLLAAPAMADYSFAPFDALNVGNLPPDGGHFETDLGGGAVPVATYSRFEVSAHWVAGGGGPWSNEANLFFTDNDINNISVIYQNGYTADNGAADGNPIDLTWTGVFATSYQGGDPLWFLACQAYVGSTADWTGIDITLIEAMAMSAHSLGTLAPGDIANGDTTGHSNDFKYNRAGDDIWALDHPGGTLDLSLAFDDTLIDLDMWLFDSAEVELDGAWETTSPEAITGDYPAGTYYVLVDGWEDSEGAYTLTYTPEPTSLALLVLGGLAVVRRRR
ncbi:MAG: PEP-CTERM sorting domain-containing protein [Phycisphaerae bacterium]|nr:PEP-CTERM sorting domain-containing protein [Phycisphaerae bacterium]